jgi:hypothetical protein
MTIYAPLAVRIKGDLERLGREVWFDSERLKAGRCLRMSDRQDEHGTPQHLHEPQSRR